MRLLRKITRFINFRDLRLKLVLSPIIVNIYYKHVLNDERILNDKYILNNKRVLNDNIYYKYILNNNPSINNTSLSPKI